MVSQQQQTGFDIELKAQYYLQRQGLIYLSKHYACRFGEIDLIMKDQQCLVFVEVRSRNNPNFGSAIDILVTLTAHVAAILALGTAFESACQVN